MWRMIKQTIQTQGGATGLLGEVGKAAKGGKSGAKGGVFAALVASFQKHIQQSEAHLNVDGLKKSSHAKLALKGLQTSLLKIKPESVDGGGKAKSLLTLGAGGDKATKVESLKDAKSQLSQSLLQADQAQVATKKGEQQDVLAVENLAVDDTEKLQKHAAIGLAVVQQESREPMMKKVGDAEGKEDVFAGLEGKKNKNTKNSTQSPRIAMDTQDVAGKQAVSVG